MTNPTKERIYIYDTTLRDGGQTKNVDFSVVDKRDIIQQLDKLGIDYIEAGFPGANPTDDELFADLPTTNNAKIIAFGMTRRSTSKAESDKILQVTASNKTKRACIFGKTWDFHVNNALNISLDDNLQVIADSITYLTNHLDEVMFDAEHFFDGYLSNPDYALAAIKTAYDNGARWIVLCDTNGGTLPHQIEQIISEVVKIIPGENLAIHCHNDTENAVANSLAAIRAGVRQVQGTLNGIGERCGNANLIAIIPTLKLKMGFDVGISDEQIKNLRKISLFLDDKLNRASNRHAAYIGDAAFAHKGGLHVSAVLKNPSAYEHIEPELIGNERELLVSDQSGKSNIINRLNALNIDTKNINIDALLDVLKKRENAGYAYESAAASFELLALNTLNKLPDYYDVRSFRVIDERRWNAKGKLITFSEAKVKMLIDSQEYIEIDEGNGPVNALNNAIKKVLKSKYPVVNDITLIDYKVRIISNKQATEAVTRVHIESKDKTGKRWTTIGVSENVIDASYKALNDSFIYSILKQD